MTAPGRRVFVTGCTGFVGAYAAEHLQRDPDRAVAMLVRPQSDRWRLDPEAMARAVMIESSLDQPDELRAALQD
ncbi:MAG: NAD-dependent epimerase/dehydratase family protein, partial [Longimicrobiales bacterium]